MELKSKLKSELIPDLTGKVVIITGGNSGIGLETGKVLVKNNATVILACRNISKFHESAKNLSNKKKLYFISPLNLSNLKSIDFFSNKFNKEFNQLDILINNAGVMNTPFEKTVQGVEIQFGINHLGHYALCGQLLDSLIKTDKSRVVNVSSILANDAIFDPSKIYSEDNYDKKTAYKFSKLANLYFSIELDRQFKKNNLNCISVTAHPGYSKSNLQRHSKGLLRKLHIFYTTNRHGQSAKMGALPILRAATEIGLTGKEYFYPDSNNGLKGFPIVGKYPEIALNEQNAKELWSLSEKLTNIKYDFKL